jgi:hypothetical protein
MKNDETLIGSPPGSGAVMQNDEMVLALAGYFSMFQNV